MSDRKPPIWIVRVMLPAALLVGAPAMAVEFANIEGVARGFPALRDASGNMLADGDFAQWLENEQLHVRVRYDFGDGRRIEETAAFRQQPELVQDAWSFRETRSDRLERHFEVDFRAGAASASKREDGELRQWTEEVDVDPGRSFAGIGFSFAIKGLRPRLLDGERVELRAVGFTPEPRVVSVELSHGGVDRLPMGGRTLRGDRFVIHPNLPWIAGLFVDVPDTLIWLTSSTPAGFLRWRGPLAEPDDPIVRVDLLPGEPSGPAEPVESARR